MAEVPKVAYVLHFWHFGTFLIFGCCVVGMICWLIFDGFLIDFGVENLPKIYPKSIPKAIENKMRFGMDFGGLLERFWSDFGPKLGGKLGPSWHQNRRKWGTKTMSKNHWKSGAAEVTQVADLLAPNNTTIPTVLAAGSWLAVQMPYRHTRRAQGPGADIKI